MSPSANTVSPRVSYLPDQSSLKASVNSSSAAPISGVPAYQPRVLHDVLRQAAERYPLQELSFVSSSSHNGSVQVKTYGWLSDVARHMAQAMSEWQKPKGTVVVVYLTEHDENMSAVWACLLAGLVPCLQPALSAQQQHREGHIQHIQNLFKSPLWLTNEVGAEQLRSASTGLNINLMGDLKAAAEKVTVPKAWSPAEDGQYTQPDDEAILFLTSGSTGFSKAVVHTHRSILAACHAKGANYELSSQSKILNWVGFDHVAGSLEMHITPLLFGASQLHAHASAIFSDPLLFLRLIDAHSIDFTFAPNFLFAKAVKDLSNKTDVHGTFDLSSLRRVNSGGEAVVSKTAQAFAATLKRLSKNPAQVFFKISPGFGMTETCAGCIYNPLDMSVSPVDREFLDLGYPVQGCEMRIVDPEDSLTPRVDGESGELQVRGPMLFARYYNNEEATTSSILAGGWYRTGDAGIIENGSLRLTGRIKDTIILHGVSYGIPELETHLQVVEGAAHSYLAVAPYRAPGQDTEGFVVFYGPSFNLYGPEAAPRLAATNRALRDICIKMVTLPPTIIVPIPVSEMEKTTLGKLSRARLSAQLKSGAFDKHLAHANTLLDSIRNESFVAPRNDTETTIAGIFAEIFGLDASRVSASDNFFELGGTSIDILKLKQEVEASFNLPEISVIRILKQPTVESLANLVYTLRDGSSVEYDPIVPLQLTGDKTPIFFVHPGVGEVLIFVNLAKYFHGERPFYALRARGFEEGQPFFTSMDEMVSCYAENVRKTQAKGPYAIAGYSYGGVVAFEVAKRLEAWGEEVKFVGLINIPPHIADRMHEIDYTGGMLNLSYFLGLISKQEAYDLADELRPLTREQQVQEVWRRAPPERPLELQLTPEKLDHWVAIAGSLIECGKDYNPGGSVSSVDVFYAIPLRGTKEDWLNKQLKPWSEFSRGEPMYTDVPGQHYTLMDLEHVPVFQKIFRARLEARGI